MNKFERAAKYFTALKSTAETQFDINADLAITLLRAAARLPSGVDPVQVLEQAVRYAEHTNNLTGSALDSPNTDPLWAETAEQEKDTTAEQEQAEREHCDNATDRVWDLQDDGVILGHDDIVYLLMRERADAYQAGFEAGRKAGGK